MASRVYQLIPSYNTAGQFAQSVWSYQFDDAAFPTTKDAATALISAWDTANRTTLRSCLPPDVSLLSYRARLRNASGGFNAFVPATGSVVGTRTGAQSVSALNPVVLFFDNVPSHGRGRWFIPGVSETDVEDGRFTTAYMTAIQTALDTLFDPITLTGGGSPVATFGWWSEVGNTFRTPNVALLSRNLGIQRRRMRPAG